MSISVFGVKYLSLQIRCDFGDLSQGGLEIFDDFSGDDVAVGSDFKFSALSFFLTASIVRSDPI